MTIRTLIAALVLAAALPTAGEEGFKLVVNASNPAGALSRGEVSSLFLKKMQRWPDGQPVQPVQPSDERLQERFCQRMHGKSVNAVKAYWNQLIFSGRDVPPIEKATEDDVLMYVRSNPGAIGLISSATATISGVKTVSLRE